MELTSLSLLLFGLELQRFPSADGTAASLGDSLEVIEAGGLSLAPYDGPAIQPVIGWRSRRVALTLAPGLAMGSHTAQSADGREARVSTLQWRTEARGWVLAGPVVAGLDVGVSGGSATSGGQQVATANTALSVGPTGGVMVPLGEHFDLSMRARYPLRFAGAELTHGLAGALGLTWHPAAGRN